MKIEERLRLGGPNALEVTDRAADMIAQMRDALATTQKLVAEAAMTGFRWEDGNWTERLFANQATLDAAIKHSSEIV